MKKFSALTDADRREIKAAGVIGTVARETGKHPSTVWRTLRGRLKQPDPAVVQRLAKHIVAILRTRESCPCCGQVLPKPRTGGRQ